MLFWMMDCLRRDATTAGTLEGRRSVTYDVVAPVSHGFLEIVRAAVHPAQTIQAGNTVETGLFLAADVVHRQSDGRGHGQVRF